MTGAVAAAKIASVEPRAHGRKDPGKGQHHFEAAMKAARPGGEHVRGQARTASANAEIASVIHRKAEAKLDETTADKTPSLAEVLQNALRPATATKDAEAADTRDNRPADDTDGDDAAADSAGWTSQARFDAAIWKALGPDAGSNGKAAGDEGSAKPGIDTPANAKGQEAPGANVDATADISAAIETSIAVDGDVAKIETAAAADAPATTTASRTSVATDRAASQPETKADNAGRTASTPAVAETSAAQTSGDSALPRAASTRQPNETSSAETKAVPRAAIAPTESEDTRLTASNTGVSAPVAPAPATAQVVAAPQIAATVSVLAGPEQRGSKATARDSERTPVTDTRVERSPGQTAPASNANAPQTVEKTADGDRAPRPTDDRISMRTTPSDARDTKQSSPERPTPDATKPSIAAPLAVTQQPSQQQAATPAGSVVAALSADPAWSAYFRETQPGAPAPVKSLKIQLNPSELGVVTAHLLAGDDGLSVELVAETTEAQNKLAADSDLIARSLRAIGLDVDRVTVQLATRNDVPTQSDGGQPRGFQSESGAGNARGDGGGERNGQAAGQSSSLRAGQQSGSLAPAANSGRYI